MTHRYKMSLQDPYGIFLACEAHGTYFSICSELFYKLFQCHINKNKLFLCASSKEPEGTDFYRAQINPFTQTIRIETSNGIETFGVTPNTNKAIRETFKTNPFYFWVEM